MKDREDSPRRSDRRTESTLMEWDWWYCAGLCIGLPLSRPPLGRYDAKKFLLFRAATAANSLYVSMDDVAMMTVNWWWSRSVKWYGLAQCVSKKCNKSDWGRHGPGLQSLSVWEYNIRESDREGRTQDVFWTKCSFLVSFKCNAVVPAQSLLLTLTTINTIIIIILILPATTTGMQNALLSNTTTKMRTKKAAATKKTRGEQIICGKYHIQDVEIRGEEWEWTWPRRLQR